MAVKENIFLRNFDRVMQWVGFGANPVAIDAFRQGLKWPLAPFEERCWNYNRQQKCTHLKGGKIRPRVSMRDHAVSFHSFIDGSQRIKCLLGCGFEVWNKPEWSFKWAFGMKMVEQSTNTPTASERVPQGVTWMPTVDSPYAFSETGLDIGDANPIKGRQKATKLNPEERDSNGRVVYPKDSNDSIVL